MKIRSALKVLKKSENNFQYRKTTIVNMEKRLRLSDKLYRKFLVKFQKWLGYETPEDRFGLKISLQLQALEERFKYVYY